ncbi:uncharacterized protein LOC105436817 [Strongylocentrotus purpuratus]|uniref:WSC domain-containing protein n=1 Tax=Strongylocentrotus purpuratus TaxID=7668 RepID=A0A7M7N2Z3_STRPU|nr:uncharacterized protein LOC105436817 [Strongylocentrotus purpuratus]
MDTNRMLFYIVPIILVLAHTSQSEGLSVDGCYEFELLALFYNSTNNRNQRTELCFASCKKVGRYTYAGVLTNGTDDCELWCFCGINASSNYTSTLTGPGHTEECPCSENRIVCSKSGTISVFDLLPGPQQTTEKSTSVMTISTTSAGQQSTITQHEPTPPFITEKGVTAAVLGTLCGILLIYSVIVSLLLYLSRRARRSLRNSKEPTAAKQKPYTGLDRTNPERNSYQGIYLSPNGEGDQCPNSVQTHSYQEIVTPCSSYRNDAVGQVRGRQAANEAGRSAPDDPGDENYVIPS